MNRTILLRHPVVATRYSDILPEGLGEKAPCIRNCSFSGLPAAYVPELATNSVLESRSFPKPTSVHAVASEIACGGFGSSDIFRLAEGLQHDVPPQAVPSSTYAPVNSVCFRRGCRRLCAARYFAPTTCV